MEGIGRIVAAQAEQLAFLLHENPAEFGEERIERIQLPDAGAVAPVALEADLGVGEFLLEESRHMAGESLLDRGHPQQTLPVEQLLSQGRMRINPALRQRPAQPFQVLHPLPGMIGRTRQECAGVGIGQSDAQQGIVPDRFDANNAQRHVDAVHRHVVGFPFPAFPVPPRHAVAERAVVHVGDVPLRQHLAELAVRHRLQLLLGQRHPAAAPGHLLVADMLEIPVPASGQGNAAGAAHQDLRPGGFDFKDIEPVLPGDHRCIKAGSDCRQPPLHQIPDGLELHLVARRRHPPGGGYRFSARRHQ